jgi:hypothetical protein
MNPGPDPRQEGGPLHGEALLPAAPITSTTDIISKTIAQLAATDDGRLGHRVGDAMAILVTGAANFL